MQKYFGVGDFPSIKRSTVLVSLLNRANHHLKTIRNSPGHTCFPSQPQPFTHNHEARAIQRDAKKWTDFAEWNVWAYLKMGWLHTASIGISGSCGPFETEKACGHLDVAPWPEMGTICWARGPAGPLDLLLDGLGFLQITGRIWYSQYLLLRGKGKRMVLNCQSKIVFLSKSEHAPAAWAIGDRWTFKHLPVFNSQLGNK